jgi:hypothetical protein
MMTYLAPDGNTVESLPYPQVVTYSCPCVGYGDGVYESMETTSSSTEIGIKQIRIKRIIENNFVTITIRESSDDELIEYKNNPI